MRGSSSHKYCVCAAESIYILLSSRLLSVSTKAHCRILITLSPSKLYTCDLTALTGSNRSSVRQDFPLCGVICTLHLWAGCWEVPHSRGSGRNSHRTHPKAKSVPMHLPIWAEPQCHQTGDVNCYKANEPCHAATTVRGTSSHHSASPSCHGATCDAHPASLRERCLGSPGLHAGEHPPGSCGQQNVWGSQGKAMQDRPKLPLTYLWLMKPKGVVSKILPFSEILLSDLFNSTGSGWAVICLWLSQTALNNVFIWDIINYGSQQDSLTTSSGVFFIHEVNSLFGFFSSNKDNFFCYSSPDMSDHILNKYWVLKSSLRQISCRLRYELCITPTELLMYLEIEFYFCF